MVTQPAINPACEGDEPRLAALRRYGILDTPPEPAFDDLTWLAAHACQAPVAAINFIDRDRQWFKSEVGLGIRQTRLDVSICAHAILQRDLFVVPDTLLDDRFRNNPLVTGEPRLRFYAGALLETPDGHALGTLCVLDHVPRDLNRGQRDAVRKLARQVMGQLELRRSKDAAEAANRAKDRHLAFLAHELRGPLTPALMVASAMAADAGLPPAQRADAALIRRNIELTTRLADDLLDANRIALGKLELRVEPTDVHETVRAGAAMGAAEAAAKGVRVALDLRATRHVADADPAKLTQVWTNLVKNAVKFSHAGGSVVVRTSDAAGGRVRVEVVDEGVGVGAGLLSNMFNLYEQGDRAVTREHAGLGLGLPICKGIVDAHGGTIAAASDGAGTGTTVTVELFAAAPRTAPRPAPPVPAVGGQAPVGLRILLVDDHEDTLRVMARLLNGLAHQVTTASGLGSALAAAAAGEFDLLISDVGLGDESGLDLMRELLRRRPIRGIALTGYGTAEDVRQTREAGFSAHVTKPVNFDQLQALIRDVGA